ncbi:hypothetical protein QTP86_018839 [Hemibagrus guttatus]|nr:hypothetical protein QTP86_018839 [Hemibagrus guttatus]
MWSDEALLLLWGLALIDSGAAVNLIDGGLVEELGIPTIPCVPTLRITGLAHASDQTAGDSGGLVSSTSLVEDSAPVALGRIPRVYEDFREVFSEERAARLPSHQAWDCAIDLLPNASPPRGRVYPLSLPETRAMEEYIEEALAVGHIRPSTCQGCFTSAPILHHPDPDLPFVVEVDASSSGLGAVLSQRHGEPGKLHPCAFYSRKLMAAEANYNVGNRELLSIKATLEEWRHWLEGFSVTYCPGSKNGKADALSRQFEAASEPMQPDLILPATAILAPVQWSLMEEIRRAHADEPPPAGCPATKVFVPLQFCHQVMQWVHEAPSSRHPGIRRSTQLAHRRFCWPSLGNNVEEYVQACPTCAQF